MYIKDYIDIMTSALSQTTGVTIKAGKKWRADIRNKTLEYNTDDLHRLDFDIAKGLLLHELGHIKFTTDTIEKKIELEQKFPNAFHEITNCFEDLRITKQLNNEYGEFSEIPLLNIDEYFTRLNLKENNGDFSNLPKLQQFLFITMLTDHSIYNTGLYDVLGYRGGFLTGYERKYRFNDDVIDRYNTNVREIQSFCGDIKHLASTSLLKQSIDTGISKLILDYIKEFEEHAKKNPQAGSKQSDKIDKTVNASKKGITQKSLGCDTRKGSLIDKGKFLFEYGAIARTLGHRLADILKERKATLYAGSKTSGKLLSKNVFKIPLDEKRVFSRKLENKPDKYAFYLLIDCSGSMRGKNAYYSTVAGYMLDFAIKEYHLPTMTIIYNDQAKIIKDIQEYECGGGTRDVEAFKIVQNDIKKYPDYEKIIFTITDGDTYKFDERKIILDKIKKSNGYVIGLGIGQGIDQKILEENYPNHIYIEKPEELPNEIIRLLNKIIYR